MDPILTGMAWQCFILCAIALAKNDNIKPADLLGY